MRSGERALLSLKNLSIGILSKDGKKIYSCVEDISFDIYPGEILGLLGESGSGKSMAALSIAGLLGENKKVTGGQVLFQKDDSIIDLLKLSEKELMEIRGKEISMVFQEPYSSLNPLMKVGDQIAETLELHGGKDKAGIRAQVRELIEKLKLSDPEKLMDSYPLRLSGGMCQRVMIALAIICKPRLLVADEPTTALDVNTQAQILGMLKEINRDIGTSILFISHDLALIRKLSSRVLVMYSGRILEEGITEEVFSNPAHEYTKCLLASIPDKSRRGKDLAAIPGSIPSLEEGRPKGCPFNPRCGKTSPLCLEEFSSERKAGPGHTTRCIAATLVTGSSTEPE
jgi:oligopeptide/dipeptide ABC transporter ATP-binding protein